MAIPRKLTSKIYEIKAHNGNVTSLDLGETGRVLVTGGIDRNVNLWAIGQKECFMTLTGHNRPIDCVRFAYNDNFVYSADDIGIIRRWDLNAQTIYSTLNGHMKSVRTLDFNPSGEYVVSGSNDTTVRLWDVRNQNKCIKNYRGHIAHVNSVKFSPDGLWIASAGTEGSVIIWDIRKSKQIMDFTETPPAASISCIQFHPFEFLLAVGRVDGTVSIYDLESRVCISQTDANSQFYGHPIKCITFSESGECLFVGTAAGISVIGWEPDREFDHIISTWTSLGDMKVVNRKLICGSYEQDCVSINALSIDRVIPFYNPSNVQQPAFSHNSTTRKSFSRGNQKLRLSIPGPKPSRLVEENEDNKSPSLDGQSSPNLSLELVDESIIIDVTTSSALSSTTAPTPTTQQQHHNIGYNTNGNTTHIPLDVTYNIVKKSNNTISIPTIPTTSYNFATTTTTTNYNSNNFGNNLNNMNYANVGGGGSGGGGGGPSSLKMPGERDIYQQERMLQDAYANEFDLNDSTPPIINNYDHNEMVEDFPVNQNIHQTHTNGSHIISASSSSSSTAAAHVTSSTSCHINGSSNINNTTQSTTTASTTTTTQQSSLKAAKHKSSGHLQKRGTQIAISTANKTNSASSSASSTSAAATATTHFQQRNKLSQVSSVSTTDLHKMDDYMLLKKSASSNLVTNRINKRTIDSQSQLNKENARNKNITVQFITKPPTRSRTSLELRSSQQQSVAAQRQTHRISSYTTESHANTNIPISNYRSDATSFGTHTSNLNQRNFNNRHHMDDDAEIQMLSASHEQVFQELSNRNATLQIIRNSTRSHDIVGALKQAIKMNGRTVFVDLLGAILEKTSSWNLDLCLLLLPEIHELLQSQHKFHYTRACDTLRVILKNFLPIIQENIDPWAANGLGVDVTREERQRKCIECQRWLLQIRNIPETSHFGTTLLQLQNMIVNIG